MVSSVHQRMLSSGIDLQYLSLCWILSLQSTNFASSPHWHLMYLLDYVVLTIKLGLHQDLSEFCVAIQRWLGPEHLLDAFMSSLN